MINPLYLDRTDTCIIIGNGPSVLNYDLGDQINKFNQVIRFNEYKISGFEKHVGTKTTIWSTFGRGILPKDKNQRPSKILFLGPRVSSIYTEINGWMTPPNIWQIPKSFITSLKDRVRRDTQNTSYSVTSGLTVICWMLESIYDNIHIHGFDHFQKDKSKLHHYWHQTSHGKPKQYNSEWEKNIVNNFVSNKKIYFIT